MIYGNRTYVRANVARFKPGDEVPLGQFPAIVPEDQDYDSGSGSGAGAPESEPYGCDTAEITALGLPSYLVRIIN